jgi:hypothetical protein
MIHRFMVVPDSQKATARALALQVSPQGAADGLWLTGLSATGTGAPTHWVSTGMVDSQLAALLGDAAATFAAYQAAGGSTITLAQIQALYAAVTIRADAQGQEVQALAALGLKLVQPATV